MDTCWMLLLLLLLLLLLRNAVHCRPTSTLPIPANFW
jgi:hypothetical protein